MSVLARGPRIECIYPFLPFSLPKEFAVEVCYIRKHCLETEILVAPGTILSRI